MLNSGRGHSCNYNNWVAETGGFLSVQSHPRPYSKFQTSLVYSVKSCLKLKTKNKKQVKKDQFFFMGVLVTFQVAGQILDKLI